MDPHQERIVADAIGKELRDRIDAELAQSPYAHVPRQIKIKGPNIMQRIVTAIVLTSLAVIAFSGMILVAMMFGPGWEARLFPVLVDQKTYVTRDGNKVTMEITMNKVRECKIETLVWQLARGDLGDKAKIISRSPISVSRIEGKLDPLIVYPTGYLRNGPFRANLPESNALANEITGHIEYRCHPLWTTPQIYGPFTVPPA